MGYIPEPVFEEFLTELSMYNQHLRYVLEKLDNVQQEIQEEHDLIAETVDYESCDDGDVWWKASTKVLGRDTMFVPYSQKVGAISGYCVVVYQLFERFLEELCRLKGCAISGEFGLPDFFDAVPALKGHPSYAKIDELRLVVNFCKHGRGAAEKKLLNFA